MADTDTPTEDPGEAFGRAQNWRYLSDPDRAKRPRLSVMRIVAYATRERGQSDPDVEQEIATNPRVRRLYYGILSDMSEVSSEFARAASQDVITQRDIGPHRMKLIEEASGLFLLIEIAGRLTSRFEIEARDENGQGVRIPLGKPVNGALMMGLDPRFPELVQLGKLLQSPKTSLWLLRVLEES